MKSTNLLLLGGFILLAGIPITGSSQESNLSAGIPTGTLTVETAHSMALERNPGIQEALQSMHAAKARLDQARSTRLPTVSVTGSYYVMKATAQPDWDPSVRFTDNFEDFNAGFQVSWTIFDGFARKATILASKYAVDEQAAYLRDIQRLLLEAVSTAFYQAQLAREQMIVARQDALFNNKLEQDMEFQWQAGEAAESQKLNFSVRALEAEASFDNARNDFETAIAVLASLLGFKNAELPDPFFPAEGNFAETESPESFEEARQYAMENRPDLRRFKIQQSITSEQKKSVRGQYYPNVNLVGGVDYIRQTSIGDYDQDENNQYVGLALNWNIFDGNRKRARLRELDSQSRTLEYSRQRLLQNIESEIRQRILDVDTAASLLEKNQSAYEQTKKIVDHVLQAFEAGEESITRLNEAQTNYVRVAGNLASAKILSKLRKSQLDAVTGRILEGYLNSPPESR